MEVKPGYKQTEVGVIPADWEVSTVGDSFDICNQLRLPISQSIRERMAGPYPYYGPTSVQGWINEYRVDGKYALIGEDGDHFLKWQHQPMTLLVEGKFNVNNHAHLVRGTKNCTDWFYWFFSNRDLTPYLTRQKAMDLVVEIYQITKKFPKEELFSLTSQIQRAVTSVPANIAEGHGRLHRPEYIRFLSIARGSLTETETHLQIAIRLGYINQNQAQKAWDICQETGRMLNKLIQALKKSPIPDP